jgi:uncharacterized membrane protein
MSPDTGPSSPPPLPGERASDRGPVLPPSGACSRPGWRTWLSVAAGLAYPFLVYGLLAWGHPSLGRAPATLLFLPPVCVNLGLAWVFGHTLAPGSEALITRFARIEDPEPGPAVLAYTRRLTWVWVVFFLVMAAVSAALAASGAREAWVWFTAVGNYLCVVALFAVEYVYRRRRFPHNAAVPPRQQIQMLRSVLRKERR